MDAAAPPDDLSDALSWRPMAAKEKERFFEKMLAEHGPRVLAIASAISGSYHDAQDIAQEVFSSLHSALSRDMIRQNPRAWLRAAAVKAAFGHVHRESYRRHRPILGELAQTLAAPESIPAEDLELYGKVLPIIESLPEKQRQAFGLRAFEGMSFRDIGKLLRCRPETARTHWKHARRQLRIRAGSEFVQ